MTLEAIESPFSPIVAPDDFRWSDKQLTRVVTAVRRNTMGAVRDAGRQAAAHFGAAAQVKSADGGMGRAQMEIDTPPPQPDGR